MKTEIEEAVVEEEATTSLLIIPTEENKPALPSILDKDGSLAKIKAAYEKYSAIEIADTRDKANYDKIVSGIRELRESRLAWDNAVDENLFGPAKKWYNELKADYDAILADFKAKEALLKVKKTLIDNKKADEKLEEERKKTERLTGRIEKLMSLGAKNTGANYTFEYDLTLFVPVNTLKDLDDAKFEKQLKAIQLAYDTEEKRKQDEANAATLLAEQNKAASEQLALKQRTLRLKELRLTGFEQDVTGAWILGSVEISNAGIDTIPDDEWDAYMEKALQGPPEKEEDSFDFTPTQPVSVPQTASIEATEQEEDFEFTPTLKETITHTPFGTFPKEPAVQVIETSSIEETYSRSIVFSKSKPYIEFPFNNLKMRICDTSKVSEIAQGLGEYETGEVNSILSYILFQ